MKTCYASDCDHNFKRGGCKSYFRFPTGQQEINKQWLLAVRKAKASDSARICSCHFLENAKQSGPRLFHYNNFGNINIVLSNRWPAKLLQCLSKMQNNGFLCDVTIETADNQAVQFHSVVLIAASPVMQDILEGELGNDSQLEGVTIKSGYRGAVWRALVAFLYNGERRLSPKLYCDFVELVEELEIKPLKNKIHGTRDRIPITAPRVNAAKKTAAAEQQKIMEKLFGKQSATENSSEKEATGEEGSEQQAIIEESSEKQAINEESSEKQAISEESSEKQAIMEEGSEKQAIIEESSENQAVTEESSEKQPITEESSENQPITEESSEKQAKTEESSEEHSIMEESSEEQAIMEKPFRKMKTRQQLANEYWVSSSGSDYTEDEGETQVVRKRKIRKPIRKKKKVPTATLR